MIDKEYHRRKEILEDFHDELLDVYQQEGLKTLSGFNNDHVVNGVQIVNEFLDAVRPLGQNIPGLNGIQLQREFIASSHEVLHFVGLTLLYYPYIFNPLDAARSFAGRTIYPYSETIETRRFFMYYNTSLEKLYNFWDRVGDLIALYYPGVLKSKAIFFSTAVNLLEKDVKGSVPYEWLVAFQKGYYQELNQKRIQIVHYTNPSANFVKEHLENASDKESVEKLIQERAEIPTFLKHQLDLTLEGFLQLIDLMKKLNKIKL